MKLLANVFAVVAVVLTATGFVSPAQAQTPPAASPTPVQTSVPGHLLQVLYGPRAAAGFSFAGPDTTGLPHLDGEAAVRREFGNTVPVAFPGYNVTYAGADGGRSLFLAQVWFANPDGVRAIRLQAWTKVGDFLMSVPANSPVTEVRQTRIGGLDVLSLLPTAAVAGGIGPRTIYLTNGATIWVVELDGFTDNAEALQVAATLAGIVTTPNPPATGNSDSGDAAGLGRITPGAALAVLAVSALLGRLLWAATGSRRRLTTNARD